MSTKIQKIDSKMLLERRRPIRSPGLQLKNLMRKRKNLVCGRKKPELQGGHYSALTPALDPHLQKMTELADRAFCIYSEQAPSKGRRPRRRCQEPGERWMHIHEVSLEAEGGDRAQAGRQLQGS